MMMRSLVVLLLGAVAMPAVARAQLALDVEPVMGKYSPRGSYDHDANYFRVGTPESPQENAATAYGVNARLWLTRTFAVQLQGMTSSADHPTVYVPSGGSIATSTRVRTMTAQAVFRPALPTRAQLWMSAGGGVIKHSGTAYAPYGSPTHHTLALGAGGALPIWRGLSATAGVDDLFYHWKIANDLGVYQTGSESDLVARIGLSLTLR
jgi:hypothetical protein